MFFSLLMHAIIFVLHFILIKEKTARKISKDRKKVVVAVVVVADCSMKGHQLWVKHKQRILLLPQAAVLPASDAGSWCWSNIGFRQEPSNHVLHVMSNAGCGARC